MSARDLLFLTTLQFVLPMRKGYSIQWHHLLDTNEKTKLCIEMNDKNSLTFTQNAFRGSQIYMQLHKVCHFLNTD
jgi:hypothetical protein